jgi:ABC-type uncharacterized transport system substrate-binding protein
LSLLIRGAQRARCQAEIPLIVLCRFPGPALKTPSIAYSANQNDQYRRAAYYVDRILKGEKPAELPVQQTVKFELAINLKAAKALGLDVPPSLLARADEVIE